jgi:hypothetical protein
MEAQINSLMVSMVFVRLPICEKNVGTAKYAFNALQVKFMVRSGIENLVHETVRWLTHSLTLSLMH